MGIFRYYPENSSSDDRELDKKIFRHSFTFAFFFIALFWIVKIVGDLFGIDLYRAGILPRHINGLWGILFSPFIHSGYNHLISNTLPFFILLFALVYFYRRLSYQIFFLIYFLSGICVWLGGRESWHIGASGVVYGLAAFHFVSGIIRNDLRLLIISAIVVFLYGGMIWGILPLKPEISWESHLWGAVSGVFLAFYYRKYALYRRKFDWEEEPEREEETEEHSGSTNENEQP
jgi:membrane associated rhomboid family serine protease